jgi:hypothetical protein
MPTILRGTVFTDYFPKGGKGQESLPLDNRENL